ncbi:MAG: S8 family serine peptidase, partial [Bacteroidales bacterium]|nr:S8 family serine peptidase [Bacteroidales bacterium]
LVFSSMGNEADDANWRVIVTPADADSVMGIGGIEDNHPEMYKHINFSSYGPTADYRRKPNVCAYGKAAVANTSLGLEKAYGTSFSCPLVAGFAACAWQLNRNLTAMQMKDEIEKSADLYPYYDYAFGYGVPQASYFLNGGKTPHEPTFSIKNEENVITIKPNEVYEHNYLFYNIENELGQIIYYEHITINDAEEIKITNANKYPNCKITVYYNGYIDSCSTELSNGAKKYPVFPKISLGNDNSYLKRSIYHTENEYTKVKKWHCLVQVSAGVAGFKTMEKATNKAKYSFSFLVGTQWDASKIYHLGFGVGLASDNYTSNNFIPTSYTNLKRDRIAVS